jgi:hypothetical protein
MCASILRSECDTFGHGLGRYSVDSEDSEDIACSALPTRITPQADLLCREPIG